jgi:type IV pilus assembly protein PilX
MKICAPFISIRRRQQGVALFVALIAMVLLSLAGIAVTRSVETATAVAGNIAFRQGSIGPVNQAIETAVDALFKSKTIAIQDMDDTAHGYYALLQPAEQTNGVPDVLAGDYVTMKVKYVAAGLPAVVADPVTQMEVRSVIERICSSAAPSPWPVTIGSCDTQPPKVTPVDTDNQYKPIPMPPIPNFRVTVRVDLANSNTVSHAQAFLRAGMLANPVAGPGIRWSWRLLSGH